MRVLPLLASGLLVLCGIAACVEGVTPDCSNPPVCAPIEGDLPASADATAETSAPAPDTGTPAPTPDASPAADAADAADAAADG